MDIPEGGGWYGARSLLEWAGAGRRRAQGARPARVAPPAPRPTPPAPLSWALISPGRAIQLRVARCISVEPAGARGSSPGQPMSRALAPAARRYRYSYSPGISTYSAEIWKILMLFANIVRVGKRSFCMRRVCFWSILFLSQKRGHQSLFA